MHLVNHDNPGYGRAVNRLFVELGQIAVPYIVEYRSYWDAGTFEELLAWMNLHPQVSLAVFRFSINLVNSRSFVNRIPLPGLSVGALYPIFKAIC